MYRCAGCGLAVLVLSGEVIKACPCVAPVTAEIKGKASGSGGIKR